MATLTIILCAVALVGCDLGVGEPPQLPNYNEDIQINIKKLESTS